jgi:hypothetical protein
MRSTRSVPRGPSSKPLVACALGILLLSGSSVLAVHLLTRSDSPEPRPVERSAASAVGARPRAVPPVPSRPPRLAASGGAGGLVRRTWSPALERPAEPAATAAPEDGAHVPEPSHPAASPGGGRAETPDPAASHEEMVPGQLDPEDGRDD